MFRHFGYLIHVADFPFSTPRVIFILDEQRTQDIDRYRGSIELVQHFAYRGTSAQGAATARHTFDMVWLYL
jgi:hypothetical protein